jgi:pyrimidine-nucleoside phosphorylase
MRAVDIILIKRDKGELSREEINFFIQGYTRGEIADYQASALMMAILLNGMTARETTDLTIAMAHSGEILNLTGVVPVAVDKHSTGGVGDKTSLVAAPTVAACGLPVGKMSGHGLGFSGGTLDKLESIPGFRSDLTTDEFLQQLRTVGIVLTGQSVDLAPADGKLYALRDVTGTVQSIPLIASSIMSKKIAAGAQAILLDVKVGVGAFMTNLEDAKKLAELMVEIGKQVDRRTIALLSDMNQPLGYAVGNALELEEAIETLNGGGPHDFREHCLVVSSYLLVLGGLAQDETQGRELAEAALVDGHSYKRFRALVHAQGGDVHYVDEPGLLPKARLVKVVGSPRSGYLEEVNARTTVHHKVGEHLEAGEPLFTVHANDEGKLDLAIKNMLAAHGWSDEPVEPLPLYYGVIR